MQLAGLPSLPLLEVHVIAQIAAVGLRESLKEVLAHDVRSRPPATLALRQAGPPPDTRSALVGLLR